MVRQQKVVRQLAFRATSKAGVYMVFVWSTFQIMTVCLHVICASLVRKLIRKKGGGQVITYF